MSTMDMPPTVPDEAGVAFVKDWHDLVDQHNATRPMELVLICPLHHAEMQQTENVEEVSGPSLLRAVEFRCPEQCTYNVLLAIRPKEPT